MNPYKQIHFALGTQGMIKGWNEGLLLLNEGAKATFVIPSALAYGAQPQKVFLAAALRE